MLGQSEGVFVRLFAKFANEISDQIEDLRQLRLCLLRHLHHVELGVDVAWKNKENEK